MNQINRFGINFAFILGTIIFAGVLWSATTSLEGVVKSISQNMITLSSKSPDGMAMQEFNVEVNDQTKLAQFASLNELQEGDLIRVDYKEEGSKKIATQVAKQRLQTAPGGYRAEGR